MTGLRDTHLTGLHWFMRNSVCCAVLCLAGSLAASASESVPVKGPGAPVPPEMAEQYSPQLHDFVAYNVAHLRNGPLLRPTLTLGFSTLKGVTPAEMAATKANLAQFGVDATPSGAKPTFLFVTPDSAADLRKMLVDLGVPQDRAGVEWSIYLQTRDPCYLQTLDDLGNGPGGLAIAVGRADATVPKPAVCLNNTVLNALGLYKGIEQFGAIEAGPFARAVDVDFVARVTRCKTVSHVADAIADCVLASYAFQNH